MVIAVETQSSLDSKIVLVFYVVFEIDPLRVVSCIFHVGEPVCVPPPGIFENYRAPYTGAD